MTIDREQDWVEKDQEGGAGGAGVASLGFAEGGGPGLGQGAEGVSALRRLRTR